MSERTRPAKPEHVLSVPSTWSVLDGSFDVKAVTVETDEFFKRVEDFARFATEDIMIRYRTSESVICALRLANPELFNNEAGAKDVSFRVAAAVMLDVDIPSEMLAKRITSGEMFIELESSPASKFLELLHEQNYVSEDIRVRALGVLDRLLSTESGE